MPKIDLMNTETGELQSFEPVDAREVLKTPGSIYTVPEETRQGIGAQANAAREALGNSAGDSDKPQIPQLQGADAEMQVGLSVNKYGRGDVVKAQIGDPANGGTAELRRTSSAPTDHEMRQTMTVVELKARLDEKGVEYAPNAKKADLQQLLAAS